MKIIGERQYSAAKAIFDQATQPLGPRERARRGRGAVGGGVVAAGSKTAFFFGGAGLGWVSVGRVCFLV